jgi:type II secretory pathway pseudopilin PulG
MRSGESGFTLVGAMIAVLIVNVALGVAVTSWVTIDRRAREAELIWRGQQIARAIGCYQQASPTEPLERLEQLVESNCLRRLYRDPMARSGDWRILRQEDVVDGTVAALLGQTPANAQSGSVGFGSGGSTGRPEGPGASGGGLGITSILGQGAPGGLGNGLRSQLSATSRSGARGIVGVVSSSIREGMRQYGGRRQYSEWVFLGQTTAQPQ